jgi:ATP-dependent DNA helicase RecG
MSLSVNPQIVLLRTILNLEIKNGYSDRAVMGGLDKYIQKMIEENILTHDYSIYSQKLKRLLLSSRKYSEMEKTSRILWIEKILEILNSPNVKSKVKEKGRRTHNISLTGTACVQAKNSSLDSPITVIKGVGEAIAKKFTKLGVSKVRDLLYFFPRRFIDFSQLKTIADLELGKDQTVFVNVWETRVIMLGRNRSSEAVLGDSTGNIRAVWFNQPWVAHQLKSNTRIALSGKVNVFNYTKVFENPEWEILESDELTHTGRLVPVYPLTQGLFARQTRSLIKNTLDSYLGDLPEFLPDEIRNRSNLLDLQTAIKQAHYPSDYIMQNMARQRLAFDELFLLQLGVLEKKRDWQEGQKGHRFNIDNTRLENMISALPFKLTQSQLKVVNEICGDLLKDIPMSRLLQGDVGSGKTVVAMIALIVAIANGYQGALMAPTEILAEQHFNTIKNLLSIMINQEENQNDINELSNISARNLNIVLLTGGINTKEKREIQDQINHGHAQIVIGTHALIQKGIKFSNLGLVIIDEQHRFGVLQRSELRQKGYNPHLLVMTATPIPRTLALTLYGDLDISVIDEVPPGRQAIKTRWLKDQERERAYNFIRKQVFDGRQAFIICPMIEESENLEIKAAVAEHERLSKDIFPDLKLGLLHGKMRSAEKEAVLLDFKEGKLDVLISTSVVEVGIDIPNATIMLVEAADRFGLAQLHQFRGRVGRGQYQSYCLLLAENPSSYGQERLKAIEETSNGFELAEKDLKLRGPGEFFGTRQSGLPDLKMAKLSDTSLLEKARSEARILFEKDPELKCPENALLAKEFIRIWQRETEND